MENIWALILPLTSLIIGGYITFYVERNKNREMILNQNKREIYSAFLTIIIDIFGISKYSAQKQKKVGDPVEKLFEFYKGFLLYASPKAINAFADYMQSLYKNPNNLGDIEASKKQFHLLTNLIGIMREELGLSNKDLGKHNIQLLRSLITDFDALIISSSQTTSHAPYTPLHPAPQH